MCPSAIHAVLVEDNPADSRLIAETMGEIRAPAIELKFASSLAEGIEQAKDSQVDVVLLDLSLPDSQGFETFERFHAALPGMPVVILTGMEDDLFALRTLQFGAQDYLVKGDTDAPLLKRSLQYAIQRKRAEDEIRTLNAELEQRVAQRTEELAAANKELEAFSYAVAHDMRRSLRAIDSFTALCAESLAARFDSQEQDYFGRIRRACSQMEMLIDALLSLSRLSLHDLRRDTVDLRLIAWETATALAETEPRRKVKFVIPQTLECEGDFTLLRVLIENLFSNAWKFTRKQSHARIELGTLDEDGQRVLFVRDNGVGFSMDHASKLFHPFERLHSEPEFEGVGIGLATVERIVRRHGGRIWAEAAVNDHATFYFTLAPPEGGRYGQA